jgi:hypothetical protein
MIKRKIEAMYERYGKKEEHSCPECCNFIEITYHDKTYFKCKIYGISGGEGTDWRRKYKACGIFNCHFGKNEYTEIKELLKHSPRIPEVITLENQIGMEEIL